MRLSLLPLALVLIAPTAAVADEAPKPAKVKKICRETPARTGSHFRGKRVCRTAAEWKERDQAVLDYDRTDPATPIRSQGNSADD